jgi:starch synthase (maltosyl-transferring)
MMQTAIAVEAPPTSTLRSMELLSEPPLPSQMVQVRERFAPKIYYFHPLLAGPRASWPKHLRRCKDMGFDHVLSAPLAAPGHINDLFATAEHDRINPSLGQSLPLETFVKDFADDCSALGLGLLIDVVPGRVAADAKIAQERPNWFDATNTAGSRIDPRVSRAPGSVDARFDDPTISNDIADWWAEHLLLLADAGVTGFRCEAPQLVSPSAWRRIINTTKQRAPHCSFLAWTPGLNWTAIIALQDLGFDGAFSSEAWWDGRANWFVQEHELLRRIGSVIGCAEAPYGPRLALRVQNAADRQTAYRHFLRRAAATSDGVMAPMGIEFAATVEMKRQPQAGLEQISANGIPTEEIAIQIREANALTDQLATYGLRGNMRILTDSTQTVAALLRSDAADLRSARASAIVLINTDLQTQKAIPISLEPLPPTAGIAAAATNVISGDVKCRAALRAGEVRVIALEQTRPVKMRRAEAQMAKRAAAPRIVIDNVVPSVDGGRFAAKRIIGEPIIVEADVFIDGHELLAVELLWRAMDENEWRRAEMCLLNNDRWRANFAPTRIGRHEFTVEAWWDAYGTFCRDLELKRDAGTDIRLEIAEGRQLLESAKRRAQDGATEVLSSALAWLTDAVDDAGADILLAHDLREVMYETEEQHFLHRREPACAIDVERPQASFGAWYELFPRSVTNDPARHGTFDDVIHRLPAIRDMGFDVLYLPPIHPIGTRNRKGKNNSLDVQAGDVGSPYAIGSSEGGHETIHPALGTLADFKRLRDAAKAEGLEIALDFAIQCSPDHPWLRDHPEWFNWRPDGSLRYAENPPKKYQDIVNVDFYGPQSFPALWNALRDVVLFWCDQGVRIFRVDNPHTKPLPFWEWFITQIRGRFPDVIFLSEAFTRPKMMYRLAKTGFSQSYTYFTWRNSKQELTDYFTELTTTNVKDYFRPHLFVNTPDINPYFLQTSGRAGFLIRAALATTLSGLWGMYSGFELCEAAALPGREEYLDSEKFEIRVRDYDAPGNIKTEITKLNWLRKSNPVLQSHLGLRFYPAHNDQVLLYGKMPADQGEMILVAVNLDPFRAHEVTIEVPLWEWRLPDDASIMATDLIRDTASRWHGKLQRIRLDPNDLPFAVWRLTPTAEV